MQLSAAKKADETIAGNARARRAKARKRAEGAALDACLAQIDQERDAARAALWAKHVSLPLPDPESKLVQQRSRPPLEPPKPAVDDGLTAARVALTAALEAHARAELDHQRATRVLAKLRPPNFSGKTASCLELSDEQFDAISAAEAKVSETGGALQLAASNVKYAESLVDIEYEMAARAKEIAAECVARQQARAAEAEARAEEREAAEAERVAAAEHADCLAARVARLRFKFSCLRWRAMAKAMCKMAAIDEFEAALARDATRAKLLEDAAKVWGSCAGSSDKENSEPKVFRLVGKSAEEVGALASQVSQISTSAEERVALNKLERMRL